MNEGLLASGSMAVSFEAPIVLGQALPELLLGNGIDDGIELGLDVVGYRLNLKQVVLVLLELNGRYLQVAA